MKNITQEMQQKKQTTNLIAIAHLHNQIEKLCNKTYYYCIGWDLTKFSVCRKQRCIMDLGLGGEVS